MKKKFIGIFICALLIATMMPITGTVLAGDENDPEIVGEIEDEVDQSQTEHDNGAVVCSWYIWAQSFVPTKETLTGVELLLGRIGFIRSDIKVTIRNDLNGEDLATATMPYNSVPLIWRLFIGFPDWIYFDFQDISVLPGETYYITLYTDGGFGQIFSLIGSYVWSASSNPDSYLNGEGWFSNVMGDTPTPWKIWDQPFDFCFKTLYTEI